MNSFVSISAEDEDSLVSAAKRFLENRGYTCIMASIGKWETPKEVCERLEIHRSTLCKKLHRADCPQFSSIRGKGGRIVKLKVNSSVEEFLECRYGPAK